MSGAVRLLISDVDGTIVRPDKLLSEATIEAVARLSRAGIAVTLLSARPPSGLVPLARQLRLTRPVAAFNGGTLITPEGAVIAAARLPGDASRTIISLFAAAGVTIWVYADGQWFTSNAANPHASAERKAAMVDPVVTRDFEAFHGRIDKIVAVSDDFAYLRQIADEARQRLGGRVAISHSQNYFCDVTHPVANKGAGVSRLAMAIGIPLSATAVIGDMANDIPMFRKAGLPIAMGQAPDIVRRVAQWVTQSNACDGAAVAMDRILSGRLRPGSPGPCNSERGSALPFRIDRDIVPIRGWSSPQPPRG